MEASFTETCLFKALRFNISSVRYCDEIVVKEKVEVVINEFSSREYKRTIEELKVLLSKRNALRERCRAVAAKYFSLEMGVQRYWNAYRRLTEE